MSEYFEGMTDPRQEAKVKHSFIETIMIVICAVIAGCDVWEDIADYCRVKEAWFREALGLELANGIPSHDTMERIFAMLNPKEFQERFIAWVQHACGKQSREIISVDGKTMRGSGSEEQKPIHMVSAWANKAKRKNHARQRQRRTEADTHGKRMGEQSQSGIRADGGRWKDE